MAKMSRQRKSAGGEASIAAIKTYEDTIPDDGAERFLHNRDMISLTERDVPSDEEDYLTGQNEVLALDLHDDDEDAYDQDGAEGSQQIAKKKKERVKKSKPDVSTKGRYGKTSSDEESTDDDSAGGSGSDGSSSEEEDAAWGRAYHARPSTRRGRQDEETDDEQREEEREMEEKEVKRLQRKMREGVKGDDWGLDDLAREDEEVEAEVISRVATKSVLPTSSTEKPITSLPSTTPPTTLLAHLSSTDPVKLALARDFPLVVERLRKSERGIKRMQAESEKRKQGGEEGELHEGLGWLHYQTLLTYATTLAFYLHLASLPTSTRPDFSTHPILPRLLQLKEALGALEDLDFDAASVDEDDVIELYDGEEESGSEDGEGFEVEDEDEDEDDMMEEEFEAMKKQMGGKVVGSNGEVLWDDGIDASDDDEDDDEDAWVGDGTLEEGELEGLLTDAKEAGVGVGAVDSDASGSDDFSDEDDLEGMDGDHSADEADSPASTTAKESTKKVATAHAPKYALEEPVFKSKSALRKAASSARSSAATPGGDSDLDDSTSDRDHEDDQGDLGDPTHLTSTDASDKQKKTRSLRFHTSRIAATSARREAGRRKAQGFGGGGGMEGDEDLPYRDRGKGRDDAIKKSTGKGAGVGEDLEDLGGAGSAGEQEEVVHKKGKRVRTDEQDDPEAYYESVKRQRKEDKIKSKEQYDDAVAAEKHDREIEDTTTGPRSLTRAISKNRGLTPHRSKASRNPRVKQKLRYEKAKRKVGSQRAVYKGGEGAQGGAYKGEKSGISQGSKSRRF